MIRIYHPYDEWECYQAGMYTDSNGSVKDAMKLLSDPGAFDKVLKKVIWEWRKSAEQHLTNKSITRKAWCGQVACCYEYNVSEINTRKAWKALTGMQRFKADRIAIKHIKRFERKYTELYKRMGTQILPEWDPRRSATEDTSTQKSPVLQGYLFGYP